MTKNQLQYMDQRISDRKQKEEVRHDLATESLSAEANEIAATNAWTNRLNWQVNTRNADTNAYNAVINARNAATNQRNALTNAQNAATNAYNASTNRYAAEQNAAIGWYGAESGRITAAAKSDEAYYKGKELAIKQQTADAKTSEAKTKKMDAIWSNINDSVGLLPQIADTVGKMIVTFGG